ncbi:hypothetical protein PLICRDRAFT_42190 [Plicaturopsis crispa FD-325 SS-3]|nr:hypothetical protein PLICRDRAFT_42190 [Plicaturopsis crispa FD-325 SS-3]
MFHLLTVCFLGVHLLSHALAAPIASIRSAENITDTSILQFALTLEHLENAFYTGGLAKYTAEDFAAAGLPDWVRPRFVEIAEHEATHVQFLESALGADAVQACTYKFPDTDVKSFVDVSSSLETVGTSAYLGASKFLDNKDYLTAAASIMNTEARQSSWIISSVRKGSPWFSAFEIPLDLNQVFSIASGFIVDCPSTNAQLPVSAFPPLVFPSTGVAPGASVSLEFNATSAGSQGGLFATFLTGLLSSTVSVALGEDGKTVVIPEGLKGVVYALITTNNATGSAVDDTHTVAGPAMLDFEFDSKGALETLPF